MGYAILPKFSTFEIGSDGKFLSIKPKRTIPWQSPSSRSTSILRLMDSGDTSYMRWQRKQPLPKRKRSNPERTYHNRLINVRSFLDAFGVTKLFRKGEYRKQYHEKKVVAHPETELSVLYSHADAEDWFLLDFFIGSMARDHEAYSCEYGDLTGTRRCLDGIFPQAIRIGEHMLHVPG